MAWVDHDPRAGWTRTFFFSFLEGDRSLLLLSVVLGFLFFGIIGCIGGPRILTEERMRSRARLISAQQGKKHHRSISTTKAMSQLKVEQGIIPITPSMSSHAFTITCLDGEKYSIRWWQFALTGAYAFTDIKAQAQTIPWLIANLANPPTGKLSPFSVYVTLSRCRGRDGIRLLRDFDEAIFLKHPNEDLKEEMGWLRS